MTRKRLRALLVFGTRPEAIKMAPVVQECRRRDTAVETIVCSTGQHREMLNQVTSYFDIRVDDALGLMVPNQSLAGLTARCLEGIDQAAKRYRPDCIVAQGDTTTAMAASLAAFYRHSAFVHIEAGLRTGNLQAPWPEELNRQIADIIAFLHCAPTQRAANTLLTEGVLPAAIRVTGNTVVDALLQVLHCVERDGEFFKDKYAVLLGSRLVLITGHRRENFGKGLQNICHAIASLAKRHDDCAFLYPVHLNPNVRDPVYRLLGSYSNVHLVPPVTYPEFVWLMNQSAIILTDSGGVQEEAPTLRKPVLVMRETTERPEAVEAGAARLVGTSVETIVAAVSLLLTDQREYASCQIEHNPYGDGHASERVVDWMLEQEWALV